MVIGSVLQRQATRPPCASPDAPVDAARDITDQGCFSHLPVVDRDGGLPGIVSVRDLVKHRNMTRQPDVASLKACVTRTCMH